MNHFSLSDPGGDDSTCRVHRARLLRALSDDHSTWMERGFCCRVCWVKKRQIEEEDFSYGPGIRDRRSALRLSLRALAREAQIHPTYLSKMELGQLPAPSLAVQTRLTDALKKWQLKRASEERERRCTIQEYLFKLELGCIAGAALRRAREPEYGEVLLQHLHYWAQYLEAERSKIGRWESTKCRSGD